MALAPRRRARRLWDYLRSERRTLRQGFVALLVGAAAAFVAGLTLGSITATLEALPGLFILIPAAAGMQNTIFGAIGARLGTSTHTGLFEVTRSRQGVLYQNVLAGITLTFFSSLYLAALSRVSAIVFGLPSISFLDFVSISVVGSLLAGAVILVVTIVVAIQSFRHGFDLDSVGTPLIVAAGDMSTIPCLFLATFITKSPTANAIVAGVAIAACVLVSIRGFMTKLRMARRAILEMVLVVLLTPLLDILAGTLVESRLDRFVALPGLLIVIPPLISTAGDLGGILSSRLSSKLHLGLVSPRGIPERLALLDASLVGVFGVGVYLVIGVAGFGLSVATGRANPGAATMITGTFVTGLLVTVAAIVVAYAIAVATFRFGLDPDNHSVPIITSAMDLVGVLSFLIVLSVLGVGAGHV
jgi:mgtE-like transporter